MADSGERGHGGLIAACACPASAYALLQSSWRRDAELAALRTAVAGDVGTVVRASAAALAEGQPAPLVVLLGHPALTERGLGGLPQHEREHPYRDDDQQRGSRPGPRERLQRTLLRGVPAAAPGHPQREVGDQQVHHAVRREPDPHQPPVAAAPAHPSAQRVQPVNGARPTRAGPARAGPCLDEPLMLYTVILLHVYFENIKYIEKALKYTTVNTVKAGALNMLTKKTVCYDSPRALDADAAEHAGD